jgi:YVTN family beta-propeller protein
MLGLTDVVLAGLVAGAQAPADLTMLVFVTNHNSHDLVVIDAATDRILTRLPVGNQSHMAVISPSGKVYTTGMGTNNVTVVDAAAFKVTETPTRVFIEERSLCLLW